MSLPLQFLCITVIAMSSLFLGGEAYAKKKIDPHELVYNQCSNMYRSSLSSNAVQSFCSCTARNAVNMSAVGAWNNVATMSSCLKIAVRNVVFNRCLKSDKAALYSTQIENLCNCVGLKSASYTQQYARKILALNDGQNFVTAILQDQKFQRNLTDNLASCASSAGY